MRLSYGAEYYSARRAVTEASADRVLDVLWTVVTPQSMLDVGCGTGTWLAAAKRRGVSRLVGIDGPWVPKEQLEIDVDEFLEADLSVGMPAHVGRFDLALCIEVAEHLPEARADALVRFLTSRSDVVAFSAAVPGQGGTGHVNEQWQSYWHALFEHHGYTGLDLVRPRLWESADVNVIYRQNLLVFVSSDALEARRHEIDSSEVVGTSSAFHLDRVHPELFRLRTAARRQSCREALMHLPGRVARKVKRVVTGR